MAYYYSVRGWLEADSETFEAATRLIERRRQAASDQQEALYLQGWTWSAAGVNWTRYLFYGADVQEDGLDLLRALLDELCALEGELDGYLRVTGEDGQRNLDFEISDDAVSEVRLTPPAARN